MVLRLEGGIDQWAVCWTVVSGQLMPPRTIYQYISAITGQMFTARPDNQPATCVYKMVNNHIIKQTNVIKIDNDKRIVFCIFYKLWCLDLTRKKQQ